jgi:HSP20 family molecular chaperone IbpA
MNYWDRYIEEWFNTSHRAITDYEFDAMRRELLTEFNKLNAGFGRIFNDEFDELDSPESYLEIGCETVRVDIDVLTYKSYALNSRPNKRARVKKIRENHRPTSVRRRNDLDTHYHNHEGAKKDLTSYKIPLSRIENEEGGESVEDVIVSDKNIKVVLQLPINNKKENVKVVAYENNSIAISHLSSEGKRCRYTSVLPYNIDIETARSTYRNGILEITFYRK